jgi:hypothetical protein
MPQFRPCIHTDARYLFVAENQRSQFGKIAQIGQSHIGHFRVTEIKPILTIESSTDRPQ